MTMKPCTAVAVVVVVAVAVAVAVAVVVLVVVVVVVVDIVVAVVAGDMQGNSQQKLCYANSISGSSRDNGSSPQLLSFRKSLAAVVFTFTDNSS